MSRRAGRRSRWPKSITSTLVGAAVADGSITSLDDRVTRYLPALNGTAYADNTIRELLRMCSGVRWDETYSATGDSDIARLSQALKANRLGRNLSDYLSDKVWRRAGMEADAYWLLEAEGGLEMGGDNLSAMLLCRHCHRRGARAAPRIAR